MLKKDLAEALGLSGSMVSRLAALGMPCDSIAAAKRWRETHLQTARRKEFRAPPVRATRAPADADAAPAAVQARAALAQVAALGRVGALLLAGGGDLAAIEAELRQALRAVPAAARDLVRLAGSAEECERFLGRPMPETGEEPAPPGAVAFPLAVWHALVADVLAVVRADEAELIEAGELLPHGQREHSMSDADAREMASFWYAVACGQVQASAP